MSDPATDQEEPLIRFYRLIPTAPEPRRADRSAGGLIPTRALRYCDPLTSATAFGWWAFPPIGLSLMWDGGTGVFWTPEGGDTWYPLKSAQFPDFADYFASIAPGEAANYPPPFLLSTIEPAIVQIWTGWVVRTRPGWSTLIRQPANFPRPQGIDYFEGIIETDKWFGPLFINVRLTKTDIPILLRAELPLLQVTPILRAHYAETLLNNVDVIGDPSEWTDDDWSAFHKTVVAPHTMDFRPAGLYATSARRRRKQDD